MPSNIETIVDDNGISILVDYSWEDEKGFCAEVGNPNTYVQPTIETELREVEIIINGEGISILKHLSESQKDYIISKLNYE